MLFAHPSRSLILFAALILCALSLHSGILPTHAAEETVVLELWSYWGEEPMKVKFVEETIKAFNAQAPHITINLRWLPKYRLFQSLENLLPKEAGPDIFYVDSFPLPLANWVQQGFILNFKNRIDWSRFEEGSYEHFEYPDGGIYGVPIELAEYAIYYNKELFAKAGTSVPQDRKFTLDEFLEIVKIFRNRNIIPIAVGSQDRGWSSNMLFQGILLRHAGVEKLEELKAGTLSWDDEDIIAAFSDMETLIAAGVFPKDMHLLKYQQGRSLFMQEKAAMYVEGTWFFGKIADSEGNLPPAWEGKLGAMDYPIVPGGKGNYAKERMTGGSYSIRKSSAHVEEAVQFLDFMTSKENAVKWLEFTQSPFGVNLDFTQHATRPFLQELFRARQDVEDLLIPGIATLLTPEEYKVWSRDVGIAFMGGKMSIEEAVRSLQEAAGKD
ncbi:MAG: extracellular solute-binding protein [bacterium]|nr:extracellular solute-binding protein [bacterium]